MSGGNPAAFFDSLAHLFMPAVVLGTSMAAILTRLVRSSMLEVARQDYVLAARSKGLGERAVILFHMLRNALLPAITMVGIQAGTVLGGAIVIETIFAWPGLGRYLINGITGSDFPAVQGAVIAISATFVLVNLVVDLIYTALDPRVQYR